MKILYIGTSKDIQGVPVPGFGSPCIMCIIIFLITYYICMKSLSSLSSLEMKSTYLDVWTSSIEKIHLKRN